MIPLALSLALLVPHGGQYLPPVTPEGAPDAVLTQPGSGPTLDFEPARWEWWFDFHEEELLNLRERLAARATRVTAPEVTTTVWRPLEPEVFREHLLAEFTTAAEDTPRDLRASAALALGRSGSAAALVPLDELVRDGDLFVRAQAILALGASRRPEAVERLIALLDAKRMPAELFTYAAAGLGLSGQPEAASDLAARLRPERLAREGYQERAALVHAAGLIAHPGVDASLLELAGTWNWSQDAELRALLFAALGRSGGAAGLPLVLAGLGDKDNQARRSAAAAVCGFAGQLDEAQRLTLLKRHAKENDVPTRLHLLIALGRSGASVTRERLITVLERGAAGMERPYAALALGLDAGEGAAEALLRALDRTHESSLRGALAVALGLCGDARAVAPLTKQLARTADASLQGWIALALGLLEVRDAEVLELLQQILEQTHDAETLRHVALGLALMGTPHPLSELLGKPGRKRPLGDRAALIYAAGQIGDAASLPALLELWRDAEEPIFLRRYALGALGQLAEPTPRPFTVELSRGLDLNHRVGFLFELTQVY